MRIRLVLLWMEELWKGALLMEKERVVLVQLTFAMAAAVVSILIPNAPAMAFSDLVLEAMNSFVRLSPVLFLML